MGATHLNIILRDYQCTPIKDCWLLDLVVHLCNGTPLFDFFPIVDQLKKKYATPAIVQDFSTFPLTTDQSGLTLEVTVGTGSLQTLIFSSPAITIAEIYKQMYDYFTDCEVMLKDNRITIVTEDRGPQATLTIGGSCNMDWGPIEQGSGYKISTRFYHSAYRIKIQPPSGEYINHVEMDVPTGCYKIRGRVCHGKNEETSTVMQPIETCGGCKTVELLLPEVMNCSADVIYPLMDKVAIDYQQVFPELANKVMIMKGIAQVANLGREQILDELDERKQDALDGGKTDLAARVDELITIAQALPQCY